MGAKVQKNIEYASKNKKETYWVINQ